MKIFFSMRHSGAIRNFESVIRSLCEHGHEMHLSFLLRDKLGDERMAEGDERIVTRLSREFPAITFGWIPKRSDSRWFDFSRAVRFLVDFLRYKLPEYADAHKLRERAEIRLPNLFRLLTKFPLLRWRPFNRWVSNLLKLVERAIPFDPSIEDDVVSQNPDLVLVTPLVDLGSDQVDYVNVAKAHGIKSALCVHSWDNLTNKGLIRVMPDRIYVWNEVQKDEAVELHGADPSDVIVTGANTYDRWFEHKPSRSAAEFSTEVGLAADKPYLLYLGSSRFIAPTEIDFIERWITAIRRYGAPELRDIGILVRPHPENAQEWERLDGDEFGNIAVWPPRGANPVNESARSDYFDSMYHSVAIVAINTSGMIEAGIVGREVFTILDPDNTDTQEGTLHFHYLVDVGDGLVSVAKDFPEHLEQLTGAGIGHANAGSEVRKGQDFIREFVRPLGFDISATDGFVEDLEVFGGTETPAPEPFSIWLYPVRAAAYPVASLMALGRRLGHRRQKAERATKHRNLWRQLLTIPRKLMLQVFFAIIRRRKVRSIINRYVVPRVVSGEMTHREMALTEREIKRLAAGNKTIIVGPWLSEVGFEVLYWIPFLNWVRSYQDFGDRLVVVSRGGVENWYRNVTSNYIDVLDYMTPDRYMYNNMRRIQAGKQKQRKPSEFDNEVIRIAKDVLKEREFELLHPSTMYNLFMLYWKRQASVRLVEQFSEFNRFPDIDPSPWAAELPDDYIAARFYFNDSFPDTEPNREFVAGMLASLTERHEVVVLNPGFAMDDHWDFDPEIGARLHTIDHVMEPSNNLAVQTEVISRARAFVGTYGGLSYLAPFYGVDSVAFYSHGAGFHYHHLEFANKVFAEMDAAAFMAIDVRDTNLIRLVMNGEYFPAVRGRRRP
jgi:hypothetical protein